MNLVPSVQISNGQLIEIAGDKATVGSNPRCDIVIPDDPRIPDEHAIIKSVSGRWMVESLTDLHVSITGGTAAKICWLKPGDCIKLTPHGPELIFDPSEQPAVTDVPPASPPADSGMFIPGSGNQQQQMAAGSYSVVNETKIQAGQQTQPQAVTPPVTSPVIPPVTPVVAPAVTTSQPVSNSEEAPTSAATNPLQSVSPMVWAGIGFAVLVLLLILFVFKPATPTINIQLPSNSQGTDIKSPSLQPQQPEEKKNTAVTIQPSKMVPEQAIYSILLQDGDSKEFLRIGSAFAISDNQLVTTAIVATLIRNLQAEFPLAQVHSSLLETNHEVVGISVLPMFEQAFKQSVEKKQSIDKLRAQLKSASSPKGTQSGKKKLKQMIDQIIELEEQYFQAIERQVYSDVALLEVKGTLKVTLPLAKDAPAINSKVTILGTAFPNGESSFYKNDLLKPSRLQGRINHVLLEESQRVKKLNRLLIKSKGSHLTHNWIGSPVLNTNQQVVGVYSRPTPPAQLKQSPPDDLCDSPTVSQIRMLLAQ